MAVKSSMKVKDVAAKFGYSSKEVLVILEESLGVSGVKAQTSNIPDGALPKLEAWLRMHKPELPPDAPKKEPPKKAAPQKKEQPKKNAPPKKPIAKKTEEETPEPAEENVQTQAVEVEQVKVSEPAAKTVETPLEPAAAKAVEPVAEPAAKAVEPVAEPAAAKTVEPAAKAVEPVAEPAAQDVQASVEPKKEEKTPHDQKKQQAFRPQENRREIRMPEKPQHVEKVIIPSLDVTADAEDPIEEAIEEKVPVAQKFAKKPRPADGFGKGGSKDGKFRGGSGDFRRGRDEKRKFDKRDDRRDSRPQQNNANELPGTPGEAHIKAPITVKALAEAMNRKVNEVITQLMLMNVLASINQTVDNDTASKLAEKMGFTLVIDRRGKEEHAIREDTLLEVAPEDIEVADDPKDVKPRPPIVTFMGHVDHGKTSLQDAIRKTHVAAGEAGGITQHIGASVVSIDGNSITFVDTPGHAAFTQMRARGANVTDIVVLVVAADDGFMPQTIEAMNHAKAAGVPIIVAINKMDLPDANPDKVYLHMQQNDLMCEEWGGQVGVVKVSARTGMGIPDLLERIVLEAEMLELKANPKRSPEAYVLESQLEQGFGPTASVVVKNGTLRVGDVVICGEYYGKVRSLIDHRGHKVAIAGPSVPVKVAGLSGVPEAGTKLVGCKNINDAKMFAEQRSSENREEALSSKTPGTSLEDLFSQMEAGDRNDLKVIVKADVKGSSEAIVESLSKIPSEKVKVEVIHAGVGAITENDVLLAASAGAIVVGFHVRVNPGVNDLAKKENVELRLYSIIYELLEDIEDALAGRLEPEKREKELGMVRILKIFNLSKGPKICGCLVEKGMAKVGAKARVFRNNELIFNGEVRSLRHFQEDVREIRQGNECGIRLDNFADFTEGDHIQLYEIELRKATL